MAALERGDPAAAAPLLREAGAVLPANEMPWLALANAELALAMAADPGPQPMHRMLDEEREATAAELIAALPEDSREALLLFYREGQSSQQVAMLLGITDAAVRKRLSRARQQVRDDLLRRFGEFARGSAPGAAFTGASGSNSATVTVTSR